MAIFPHKSFASVKISKQPVAMNALLLSLVACAALLSLPLNLLADAPRLESGKTRSALDAMQGKPAPELALKGWMNSKSMDLEALKGKIVVLDFWATWCGPCLRSVPHTNEMMKKYAKQGVVIIGVCAQSGSEKMATTVKQHGIKYPVAVDAGANASYKVKSYPDYYLIDRKGTLRWADVANSDVEKAIDILLKEQPAKKK